MLAMAEKIHEWCVKNQEKLCEDIDFGAFLQHRDRSSQSTTNNGAPGSNARIEMKSRSDGEIQCADLIMKEERSDESGRGRRAEEIREKLALILERGFTANQIDDVPLPFVEVASRDID